MFHLKTTFKINYIHVYLTRSTRTKHHRRFFRHINHVYKIVLITIVDEASYANVNKLNIYFFNHLTSDGIIFY